MTYRLANHSGINAPTTRITCNTCSASSERKTCLPATLEVELGHPPTIEEATTAGINIEGIPGIMCPNGYTNSKNERVF